MLAIALNKLSLWKFIRFLKGDGSFGAVDVSVINNNRFNIGVLGLKQLMRD